jgi:outer membrane protein assembly factor BamB
LDGRLIVSFNDADKVVALQTSTGMEAWTAFADAPVRLPPAGGDGNVFFCSDDGYLYCVDVASGQLQWKFCGAPGRQQAIGNRRLISAWPARGGPVVRDQTVYFTASIWPFMGTFIHALDAETGTLRWSNDHTGAQYIKQPHSAPSFAGVAPQGALVATNELLIVPGGRSVPAVFDRNHGSLRYFEINAGGKGSGGSFVAADDRYFYVHTRQKGTRAFHLGDGVKTAFMPNEPVLQNGHAYSAETSADGTPIIRAYGKDDKPVWELQADGDTPARVEQVLETPAAIERLLAADGKLFAVTLDAKILAYGSPSTASATDVTGSNSQPIVMSEPAPSAIPLTSRDESVVDEILASCDAQGYGLWFGRSNSSTVAVMAKRSRLVQLAIVDPDGDAIDEARRRLDREHLYGRITFGRLNHFQSAQVRRQFGRAGSGIGFPDVE